MPPSESASEPDSGSTWWLCSHLVSLSVHAKGAGEGPVIVEEISNTGIRLGLDEPVPEGVAVEIRSGAFKRRAVVIDCRVRADDFRLEARFLDDFRWNPEVWRPDHLYRPWAGRAKGAASH